MATNKRLIKSNDEGGGVVPLSFNTVLYTGNGGSQTFNIGFRPDFIWFKARNFDWFHISYDSIRGSNKGLVPSGTSAEFITTDGLASFNDNGFTISGGGWITNRPGYNYVAWCWKAGGAAVTNTDGTITSQVSANTEAGFSIVSYTGNGGASQTYGHGLSTEPKMIINKKRNVAYNWCVYHSGLTSENYFLELNTTNSELNGIGTAFNSGISSSVVGIGNSGIVNTSGHTYISYCFAEVAGFSKFGSYVGNGSTSGPTIDCGFEPAFVMIKWTSGSPGNWQMMDNKRGADRQLYANLSNAEGPLFDGVDFLENGFQLKTDYVEFNGSGQSYIYMAFANQF